MQNKEITSYENHQRDLSSHTQQLAEHIGKLWQNTRLPPAETLKQTLANLPEPYQTMGIQAIAEHFVNTIQIHLLQTLAIFYQQAADEGIDAEERDEIRTHICTGCGVVLDRDHNAALNILHKALDNLSNPCKGTEGHSGTRDSKKSRNASGQTASATTSKRRRGKQAG